LYKGLTGVEYKMDAPCAPKKAPGPSLTEEQQLKKVYYELREVDDVVQVSLLIEQSNNRTV
jgi:hypothetical protein